MGQEIRNVDEVDSEEKESGGTRVWRYWKYTWAVIYKALAIWLVYLAFGKINTIFETLVLALLVLIFLSVNEGVTVIFRKLTEESFVQRDLFVGLYKKHDDPEIQEAEEGLRKLVGEYRKADIFWFINVAGNYIIYLFVLWKIINVLVLS